MAIAHLATEYVFSDFLLKEPTEPKFKGLRLELAVDKMVTCIAVGLPLLLISLAFAQEISIGTQISCFSPSSFSWRQAAFVDSYCWAAVQQKNSLQSDSGNLPLWLHKDSARTIFFYIRHVGSCYAFLETEAKHGADQEDARKKSQRSPESTAGSQEPYFWFVWVEDEGQYIVNNRILHLKDSGAHQTCVFG